MARPKKKKVYASEDRQRQVETTKLRHGQDFYKKLGDKTSAFKKDPELARYYAYRRWHPNWYDAEGNIKPEYQNRDIKELIKEERENNASND